MVSRRGAAFTLIEVATAMAIAGVISAAALTVFAMINRRLTVVRHATLANDRGKVLIEHLVSRLQQAGGASVRPGQAVFVQDAGAATSTGFGVVPATPSDDRLLAASSVAGRPECAVTAATSVGAATLPGAPVGAERVVLTLEPSCCQQPGALVTRHVMLTHGDDHRQLWLENLAVWVNGVAVDPFAPGALAGTITLCRALTEPGPMAVADTPAATAPTASYAGGTLTVVDPRIYYRDGALDAFIVALDEDLDGVAETSELRTVSTGVRAFEAQLGYDCDGDGRATDAAGADEWRYDGNDTLPAGCGDRELRAVEVAFVVASKVNDPSYLTSATVSPTRTELGPGHHLRTVRGRSMLRNALVAAGLGP